MQLQALPAFGDNYIWTLRDDAGDALVVDPGDAAPVLAAAADGLRPVAILLTHHHADHDGGTLRLLQAFPGIPVFGPHDDRIEAPCSPLADGQAFDAGGWRFTAMAVPGHTVSHIAVHGHGRLFCGDTLFSLGCGRLFEGTPAQMLASLDRLAALPGETEVCCGHEYTLANAAFARTVDPENAALRRHAEEARAMRNQSRPTLPSTIARERAANPFLRVDAPGIRAALGARLGRAPADRVEAFAELRRWKDGFVA